MTRCSPVPLVFDREVIEAGLLCTHLRWLDALLEPPLARAHRQRLVLGFTGYQHTPQPVYELPRVRQWMRDLDRHWPFWLYYLDPASPSLLLLTLVLCPLERTTHELELADADYQHFLRTHLAAMDALGAALGDPLSTRSAMKEAIRHALF